MVLSLLSASLFIAQAPQPSCRIRVEPLPPQVVAEMKGVTWREGCPVPLSDLALLHVPFVGFDGQMHEGELVVHRDIAHDAGEVFCELFQARFPIERMRRVEAYGGDDEKSMIDNNTSAFNCRLMHGNTNTFSRHAWGLAIDVNPLVNPFVSTRGVAPSAGKAFVRRSPRRQGMIASKDVCHLAFTKRGFSWGGSWKKQKDYQHFEKPPATSGASPSHPPNSIPALENHSVTSPGAMPNKTTAPADVAKTR